MQPDALVGSWRGACFSCLQRERLPAFALLSNLPIPNEDLANGLTYEVNKMVSDGRCMGEDTARWPARERKTLIPVHQVMHDGGLLSRRSISEYLHSDQFNAVGSAHGVQLIGSAAYELAPNI